MRITVAICSINPNNCIELIHSMKNYVTDEEVMFIIDGKKYICDDKLIMLCEKLKYQLYINDENKGLSFARNFAMSKCNSDYLIFLDDDVQLVGNTFIRFKEYFLQGYCIGGARLMLPENYKRYTKWLPKGYSYLFGVHTVEIKPWGACFGYRIDIARDNNLLFDERLGRLGNGLQSGDDTSFIQEYLKFADKQFFIDDVPLYHCFNRKRLRLTYILRRIYWQGRSEVRRNNFHNGLKKEWRRSSLKYNNIALFLTGKILLSVYLWGCFVEFCVEKRNES